MISAILARAREQFGGEMAVEASPSSGGPGLRYGELADRVARRAGRWRTSGLEPGDRIALLAPNSRLFLESYFAAAHAGLVLVPLNWRAHPEGLARVIAHAETRRLVAAPRFADLARSTLEELSKLSGAAPPAILELADEANESAVARFPPVTPLPVQSDAPAQIYYTSGTTGEPKGVVLTHRNVACHAQLAIAALGLDDRDVWAHVAPMFHLADAWATFAITWVGGRHVMEEDFVPERVLDTLAGGVTITNLVPTMLGDLVRHHEAQPQAAKREFPKLRRILSGGAPIAPALVERIVRTFRCEYVQTYGLTETSPYLTMSLLPPKLRALPEARQFEFACKTGRPLAGVDVRVVRDDLSDVHRDGKEVGEIVCRGDTVTPGYWRNPAATAAAFKDGWFLTGDLAVVDDEGFLQIVDRKKDVIKTGGESVFSTEVETIVYAHPAVQEAAVIGIPHERWGEAVVAVVVPRAGSNADEKALLAHCAAHLGRHQIPKRVVFRSALPRTGSGKIAKRILRDELRGLPVPR